VIEKKNEGLEGGQKRRLSVGGGKDTENLEVEID